MGDYRGEPIANYYYGYLPDRRLGFLKYNVCQNDPANPFAAYANAILNSFDTYPVDTLVIDLRGNGGGDSSVFQPFGQGLSARWPALTANPNFRVYVVIDNGTFSSAMRRRCSTALRQRSIRVFGRSTLSCPCWGGKPAACLSIS